MLYIEVPDIEDSAEAADASERLEVVEWYIANTSEASVSGTLETFAVLPGAFVSAFEPCKKWSETATATGLFGDLLVIYMSQSLPNEADCALNEEACACLPEAEEAESSDTLLGLPLGGAIVLFVFLALIVLLVAGLAYFYVRQRQLKAGSGAKSRNLLVFGSGEDHTELRESNPLDPGKYAIKAKDLVRTKKLGEGGFGFVYQGTWRGTDVAIKEVKGVSSDARKQIFDEAKQMLELRNHPNVISLLGVCNVKKNFVFLNEL